MLCPIGNIYRQLAPAPITTEKSESAHKDPLNSTISKSPPESCKLVLGNQNKSVCLLIGRETNGDTRTLLPGKMLHSVDDSRKLVCMSVLFSGNRLSFSLIRLAIARKQWTCKIDEHDSGFLMQSDIFGSPWLSPFPNLRMYKHFLRALPQNAYITFLLPLAYYTNVCRFIISILSNIRQSIHVRLHLCRVCVYRTYRGGVLRFASLRRTPHHRGKASCVPVSLPVSAPRMTWTAKHLWTSLKLWWALKYCHQRSNISNKIFDCTIPIQTSGLQISNERSLFRPRQQNLLHAMLWMRWSQLNVKCAHAFAHFSSS